MPLYEISHVAPLTKAQKDEMALAITEFQSGAFGTPGLFVTVMFKDVTTTRGLEAYVAGKPVSWVIFSLLRPLIVGYVALYIFVYLLPNRSCLLCQIPSYLAFMSLSLSLYIILLLPILDSDNGLL